jgi:hypothetical protein
MKLCLKHLIELSFILFVLISTGIVAQQPIKDSILKKDTTVVQKLKALVQYVIKDTIPRKETQKDTLLENEYQGRVYSFRQFKHETILFGETPLKWHSKDWVRVGVVVVLTAAIIPFDHTVSNVTQGHQSNYYIVPVILGRIYGSWYFNAAAITASVGYTVLTHNRKAEKIDVELVQAAIYSGVITEALKVTIGRATPYSNRGAFNFHPFFTFKKEFESMPNFDATSAFALSTITYRHANSTLSKIVAYLPAAFTLFADIYQNDHWASDEFIGSAIGFATGMWVVTLHEGKRHKINIIADN